MSSGKRSMNSATTEKKRQKTGENEKFPDVFEGKSIFIKMVKQCGLILMNGSRSNVIKSDQTYFIRDFVRVIKRHDDYPEVVNDVLDGVEKYIDDKQRFVRAMFTTDLVEQDEDVNLNPQRAAQDSAIRLLLKTRPLQTGVADLLIQKLEDYKEQSSLALSGDSFDTQHETINVPQLILNQLRWLDVLDDSGSIAGKLLEKASRMSFESACVIITSLPEILSDDIHDVVASKLKQLLSTNIELTIAILDTLCSLNCSENTIEELKQTIFTCLHSVKIEELPVVVKYLLQTVKITNAEASLNCLRQHLNFCPATLSQSSQTNGGESEKTSVRLTAEAVLSAIKYQPGIADAFHKLFKRLQEEEFTSSDLVLLILLCTNFNIVQKKAAVSMFKSKLQSGFIGDDLIKITLTDCSHVLVPYFGTLAELAVSFLGSNRPLLQHVGSVLYTSMFSEFNSFCRQEVIGCLVQHIGSSSPPEVDAALSTLKSLSVNFLPKLSPFSHFVKGILDHLDCLSAHQIRLIYEVMSRLAFSQCEGKTPAIQDELHMLIRKQLTHSCLKFCYIGIIGAVKILSILGLEENSTEEGYKTAISILKLLDETTSSNNKIRAYFLDELIDVFSDTINPRLEKRLNKLFHIEVDTKLMTTMGEPSDVEHITVTMFPLIDGDELGTAIPIFSAVRSSDNRHELLCPLLRALAQTSRAGSAKLETLTSGSILLHNACRSKNFEVLGITEQKMVLDSLFVTLNWFREHMNTFARVSDSYKQALIRMSQYFKVENMLDEFVPMVPRYFPPLAVVDFDSTKSLTKELATPDLSQDEPRTSGLNASTVSQGEHPSEQPPEGKMLQKSSKAQKKKSDLFVGMRNLKSKYFRELDICVFDVLKIPMGEALFEPQLNLISDSAEKIQLFPDQLLFLLLDLRTKAQHKLPGIDSGKRIAPFLLSPSHVGFEKIDRLPEIEVATQACDLMPHLCNHLESICTSFQKEPDIDELTVDQRRLLVSCYELLFEVLLVIMSWKGMNEGSHLLRKTLSVITRRISMDAEETNSLKDLLRNCFSYFKNFQSTVTEVSLGSATNLAKLLSVLANFDNDFSISVKPELKKFASAMLKTRWPTDCTGGKKNDMLGHLLRLNLHLSDDVLQQVSHFVDESLCTLRDGNEVDSTYPCFLKSNAHVLYGCLMESLVEESNKIPVAQARDDESTSIGLLLKWNDCMKIVGILIRLLREFHTMPNIVASLKYGRVLIDNFIKNGMPVCEKMFNLYQDDVVSLLKDLQISTRQLQHLTCHSKVSKNVSLSKHVPPLKRCLEALLFRVKGMLALHSCQDAFWLGNLKNRNLKGEEILSQAAPAAYDFEEESESMSHDVDMSYSESY